MTAGEQEFVNQMARKLIVDWCVKSILLPDVPVFVDDTPFLQHALQKKWVSVIKPGPDKMLGVRILSSGWDTAARFLKR